MKRIYRKLLIFGLTAALLLAAAGAAAAAPAGTGPDKAPAPAVIPAFGDVGAEDPNVLFINYLAKRNIIKGFPDGTYQPGAGLTRAEAAALLARAAGLNPGAGPSRFSDVGAHWAAGVIEATAAASLLSGYPDGTFRPDNQITRAEGISLILRLSKKPDPGVALPAMEDLGRDHWSARPAAIGLAAGMAGLTADKKRFLPDAPLSRGDLARALGVLLTRDPDLSRTALTGTLKIIKGAAYITRPGNSPAEKIDSFAAAGPGDVIQTGPGSLAELVFPDGTGMLLEENTGLAVKEIRGRSYIKPDGSPGTAVDWLLVGMDKEQMYGTLATTHRGAAAGNQAAGGKTGSAGVKGYPLLAARDLWDLRGLLAVGESEAQPGGDQPWWQVAQEERVKVQVDMPWGVAGIKGSTWRIALAPDGRASVSMLEGSGSVTASGVTENLGNRQVIEISYGAQPGRAAPMTAQEIKEFVREQVQNWLQERARDMQTNQELALHVDEKVVPREIIEEINRTIIEAVRDSVPSRSSSRNNNPVPDNPPATSDEEEWQGWEYTGLWNLVNSVSGIMNKAVGKYAKLPEGDSSGGYLPVSPNGKKSFWYGLSSGSNAYTVGNYVYQYKEGDLNWSGGTSIADHSGTLTSPVYTVPSAGGGSVPVLKFSSWWEIESVNPTDYDLMDVYVVKDGEEELLARLNPSYDPPGEDKDIPFTSGGFNKPAVWKSYAYSLEQYQGSQVRIRFKFDTNDEQYNGFRGWLLNSVGIENNASGKISGTVTDGSGPVSGAVVTVTVGESDYQATTEDDGSYTINHVPPGTGYTVTASKPGKGGSVANVSVLAGQTTANVNIPITTNTYSVTFMVVGQADAPLSGASVSFNDKIQLTEDGVTVFSDVPYGNRNYTVTRTDYGEASGAVLVEKDTTVQVNMSPDTTLPEVSSTDPDDDEDDVAPGEKTITIEFTEKVQPGDQYENIVLKWGDTVVAHVYGLSGDTVSIMSHLVYGAEYTVYIPDNSVKDMAGNALAADYTFSFTTGNSPIAAGYSHAAIIEGEDGKVLSWGTNQYGELGNGQAGESLTDYDDRVYAAGLEGVAALSAGYGHTVALLNDGTVWAWGRNNYGQLGIGTTVNESVPEKVYGSGGEGYLEGITAVACGARHTVALDSGGAVWAWGRNSFGQLGINTIDDESVPEQVYGPGGSGHLTDVAAIAAGSGHTVALKKDGTVWAWGYNSDGQLGIGTFMDMLVPFQVSGLTDVIAIAAGSNHTVALKKDGTVWAWGSGEFGQLGHNQSGYGIQEIIPVQVKGPGGTGNLTDIISIACGGNHTLAIGSDGKVWAWGNNNLYYYNGVYEPGGPNSRAFPVQVNSGNKVTAADGGKYFTLFLGNNDSVNISGEMEVEY